MVILLWNACGGTWIVVSGGNDVYTWNGGPNVERGVYPPATYLAKHGHHIGIEGISDDEMSCWIPAYVINPQLTTEEEFDILPLIGSDLL